MSDHVEKYVESENAKEYVRTAVASFLSDPPDSEYQRGFLGAMLIVAKEALGLKMDVRAFNRAEELLKRSASN